jgi:RND family efflux transporter MFP subunit
MGTDSLFRRILVSGIRRLQRRKRSQSPFFRGFLLAACFLVFGRVDAAEDSRFAVVAVKQAARFVTLPGELQPYLSVGVHARVAGYVEKIAVDRGSVVKEGQTIAELSAPEMASRIAEAESRVQVAEADRVQAEAQVAALEATYERLQKAAQTPGAIAENELVQMKRQIEAAQALVRSRAGAVETARANVKALRELESYLRITAPFDGVVTERFVHPGALVGPGSDSALVTIQQIARLRLVVAVPEAEAASVPEGARVEFHVTSNPERAYAGTVARSARSLDVKTRTLAVELDVANGDGSLAPGMYPEVKWPVRRAHPPLVVPTSSVVTTSERTFVIREHDGKAQWVDVRKGPAEGGLMEVTGDLHVGDRVLKAATDEVRDGSSLTGR